MLRDRSRDREREMLYTASQEQAARVAMVVSEHALNIGGIIGSSGGLFKDLIEKRQQRAAHAEFSEKQPKRKALDFE